jgi:hypothetical protein
MMRDGEPLIATVQIKSSCRVVCFKGRPRPVHLPCFAKKPYFGKTILFLGKTVYSIPPQIPARSLAAEKIRRTAAGCGTEHFFEFASRTLGNLISKQPPERIASFRRLFAPCNGRPGFGMCLCPGQMTVARLRTGSNQPAQP